MDEDSRVDELLHAAGDAWRHENERLAPSVDRTSLRSARPRIGIGGFARGMVGAALVIALGIVIVGAWAVRPSNPVVGVASPSASPNGTPSEPPVSATPSHSPLVSPTAETALLSAAHKALDDWAAFMATAAKDTVLVTSELTTQDHGWSGGNGDNAKSALYAGMLEANVDIPTQAPAPSEITWPDGSTLLVELMSAAAALDAIRAEGEGSPCPECTPVHVVGVRLVTHTFDTTRGPTDLASWEFTLREGDVHVFRVAAAHALVLPTDSHAALEAASADGRQLTIWYMGGACDDPDRHVAHSVESDLAVVAYISVSPASASTPTAADSAPTGPPHLCLAIGIIRSLTVELDQPLGSRTVLDINGTPISRDASWLNR